MPRNTRHEPQPYWAHSDPEPTTPAAPRAGTVDCPGWHNDAWRYAETDQSDLEATPGNPIWCDGCREAIRSPLLYLPGLAHDLMVELEEATDTAAERVSGTRTRALHEHQAQALLIDDIRDILNQFEDEVRDWRQLTARRRDVRQIPSINRSAEFLLAHLDWAITEAPDTADPQGLVRAFADRLHRLDRRAMRLTHKQDAVPEDCIGVRCKNRDCGLMALVRAVERSGADKGEILCESCGAKMTLQEYHDWAAQWGIYEYAHLDDEQRERLAAPVAAYERTRRSA
jgi:hypothetical protein